MVTAHLFAILLFHLGGAVPRDFWTLIGITLAEIAQIRRAEP
jgi:hypothetical protein